MSVFAVSGFQCYTVFVMKILIFIILMLLAAIYFPFATLIISALIFLSAYANSRKEKKPTTTPSPHSNYINRLFPFRFRFFVMFACRIRFIFVYSQPPLALIGASRLFSGSPISPRMIT